MKADGSVTLDLTNFGGGDANLAQALCGAYADAPGRKIAFKISRPDYFRRFRRGGGPQNLRAHGQGARPVGPTRQRVRGFRLVYPAAQSAEFDRIAVAVASSFEPFPSAASTPAAATVGDRRAARRRRRRPRAEPPVSRRHRRSSSLRARRSPRSAAAIAPIRRSTASPRNSPARIANSASVL